jgi:hypothetical protein
MHVLIWAGVPLRFARTQFVTSDPIIESPAMAVSSAVSVHSLLGVPPVPELVLDDELALVPPMPELPDDELLDDVPGPDVELQAIARAVGARKARTLRRRRAMNASFRHAEDKTRSRVSGDIVGEAPGGCTHC